MTVPVQIDGAGPYDFVVDCAAEASVISDRLADELNLGPAGDITMHSLAGAERVGTVRAKDIRSGALRNQHPRLIRGSAAALGEVDGLLGADLLRGHRLVFNFRGRPSVSVETSRSAWVWPFSGRRRVRFETSAGHARGGLLTLKAEVGGVDTVAILDSGAVTSVVNPALVAASGAMPLTATVLVDRHVVSPTGLPIQVAPYRVPDLRLGGVRLGDQAVLAADLHTFRILGYADRPAMLMAMDVFRQFRMVVIDTRTAELILQR